MAFSLWLAALPSRAAHRTILQLWPYILWPYFYKPALEGCHRAWHVQVLSYFSIAYKYDITHRLSQHLAALSRNSMEQGEREDGERGPRGNQVDDNVKRSVGHGYYCITSYICNKHELSS